MSDTLTIHCPQCGKQTRVGPSAIGKRGRCGKCSHSFLIQPPAAVASEPADAGDGLVPLETSYDLVPLDVPPLPAPRPAMAPQPAPAKAASPATPPGRSPQVKRVIDDGRRPSGSPALIMGLALGGAGLLTCVLIAVAAWVLMRPKGPAAVAGNGAAAQGAAVANAGGAAGSDINGIKREPKAGSQYWIPAHPLASADPATWKVTAEETAPASGLHSLFVLNTEFAPVPLFSAPQTAQAATLLVVKDPAQPENSGLYRLEWTRHDLRTGLELGKVPTSLLQAGSNWNYLCALSPSGKQLAVAFGYPPGQLEVWSDDGSKVATIGLDAVTDKARPRRVRFASESRVLVDVAGKVTAYDLPAGSATFQIETNFAVSPILSCGGKWLAGYAGDGIAWFSTADGSPAGKIEFGEYWQILPGESGGAERLDWGLAFHPSGKSVAVVAIGKSFPQTLIAHFDLATGRAIEQFVLPDGQFRFQAAYWCGERQLHLSSGHVVDLDLKTWLGCLGDRERLSLHFSTQSPDQRCWQLLWESLAQKIDHRLGLPEDVKYALVASTVPDSELKRRRAEAQDALIWGPDFAVAVGTGEVIKDDRRPQVLAAMADMLAERGFRVDPAARFRLLAKEARALSVPDINNPGKYGYIAELHLELVDSRGQTVDQLNRGRLGVTGEGGYDECWAALCGEIKKIDPLQMKWRQPDGTLIDPHHVRLLAIDGVEPKKD